MYKPSISSFSKHGIQLIIVICSRYNYLGFVYNLKDYVFFKNSEHLLSAYLL